ncbi:MAG: hypothetical protein ACP5G1_01210 [Nanopusillaceae archaeon]
MNIAIEQVFYIIIGIISFSVLAYLMYNMFFSKSSGYYCKTLISQGGFSPECSEYYPSAIKIYFENKTKSEIAFDIAGYILNCYNKNVNTDKLLDVCYDLYIAENVNVDVNDIITNLNKYTTFDTKKLELNLKYRTYLAPRQSIFIIYNNSKIILWQ